MDGSSDSNRDGKRCTMYTEGGIEFLSPISPSAQRKSSRKVIFAVAL